MGGAEAGGSRAPNPGRARPRPGAQVCDGSGHRGDDRGRGRGSHRCRTDGGGRRGALRRGAARLRRRRLRVDWSPRGGAGRRRSPTRTEGSTVGDTRVRAVRRPNHRRGIFCRRHLAPWDPGAKWAPRDSRRCRKSSAPSSALNSPRKPPRLGFGGVNAAPPPVAARAPRYPRAQYLRGRPVHRLFLVVSRPRGGSVLDPGWRYLARRAVRGLLARGSIEPSHSRAWYLAFAFIPVFRVDGSAASSSPADAARIAVVGFFRAVTGERARRPQADRREPAVPFPLERNLQRPSWRSMSARSLC